MNKKQIYTFYASVLVCVQVHVTCLCGVWRPENNLRCHPQEYRPPPLKQGLVALKLTIGL